MREQLSEVTASDVVVVVVASVSPSPPPLQPPLRSLQSYSTVFCIPLYSLYACLAVLAAGCVLIATCVSIILIHIHSQVYSGRVRQELVSDRKGETRKTIGYGARGEGGKGG